jgi:hypothetical protein
MHCSQFALVQHHVPHESDTTPGSTARCCGCSAEAGSLRQATRSCRCLTSGRCCRQRAAWRLRVARSRVCWSCSSFFTISYRSYYRNFPTPPLMTLPLLLYQLSWMHWGYKWYPAPLPSSQNRSHSPHRFANLTWDNPGFFFTDGYNACSNRTRRVQPSMLLMMLCEFSRSV